MSRYKGILIILILLAVAVFFNVLRPFSRTPNIPPVEEQMNSEEELRQQEIEDQKQTVADLQDRVETQRREVLERRSFTFPSPLESNTIELESLPKALSDLIDNNAEVSSVLSIRHENSVDGFSISYGLVSTLGSSHSDFVSSISADWKIIFEESKDLFTVAEIENDDYRVRISRLYAADVAHTALIQAVEK